MVGRSEICWEWVTGLEMPSAGEEEIREGQGWPNVQSIGGRGTGGRSMDGVSVSGRNPEDSQGYMVLTDPHPQPQSSSLVPSHDGSHRETPSQLPYLSWKLPREQSLQAPRGSKVRALEGVLSRSFLSPRPL